jgi:putative PIN family toxin of toxin-antitoxin system
MRVIVDTDVFVAACLGQGAARGVIAACLGGLISPIMGAALLAEHEDVVARKELFKKCRLSLREREELLDAYLSTCIWIRVYYLWRPNLSDEADNHLIELAVAGNARYVVTRNLRDLKRAELLFPGLEILSPDAFLKEL